MIARALLVLFGLTMAGAASGAEPCRDASGKTIRLAPGQTCPRPVKRLEPYDPDRVRAGSRPGFIDFGNGTEVRVGGRTRFEFENRR